MYYNDPYSNGTYGDSAYPPYPQTTNLNAGYPAPYPPASRPTNSLAIASFVLAMLCFFIITTIPSIICGHIALSQIKKDGSEGKGLAIAGLVISYLAIAAIVVMVVMLFFVAGVVGLVGSSTGTGGSYAMALTPLLQI